jgi:hypothetical protein
MTAAIFGLLGVIVGAVINGVVTALLQRRTELSDQRSAARLVRSELVAFRALALEARGRSPEHLPQLRDANPVLWQANRAVLAKALSDHHWALIARAYAHIDALLSVLVFEPDGTLVDWRRREAQRLLGEMVDPVEEGALALGEAAGLRAERLDEAMQMRTSKEPSSGQPRADMPDRDFPEGGPVAV